MIISTHFFSVFKEVHENNKMKVKVDINESRVYTESRGTRHGYIQSFQLFNTYAEYNMKCTVDEWQDGIAIAEGKIPVVTFASLKILL